MINRFKKGKKSTFLMEHSHLCLAFRKLKFKPISETSKEISSNIYIIFSEWRHRLRKKRAVVAWPRNGGWEYLSI